MICGGSAPIEAAVVKLDNGKVDVGVDVRRSVYERNERRFAALGLECEEVLVLALELEGIVDDDIIEGVLVSRCGLRMLKVKEGEVGEGEEEEDVVAARPGLAPQGYSGACSLVVVRGSGSS